MEDVLDLYAEPYDAQYPGVCFDEKLYQLVSEVRQPLPPAPGRPRRYDYEYRREGTCNLFISFQPVRGWRHVKVTERRTARDFAHCMKDLVDIHLPRATLISLVLDNLNTPTPAALYETFAPAEAHRLLRKLDFHYTPKHGSWLNMAEVELAVVSTQCLNRRLPDPAALGRALGAWATRRNTAKATVHWRFTTSKARRKLKPLYPA
jgi:hypothetical protein